MQEREIYRDRVCLITGGASGIGLALSEALLEAGATVVLADRDTKLLEEAAGRLAPHGERARFVPADVTVPSQIQGAIRGAAESLGRLDYLFNNAGIGGTLPIGTVTLEHWRRIVDINLWGVIHGIDAVLPIMRSQGSGHIVNTGSLAALIPFPFQALYCTTKYAVAGLSESLRLELADEGIHVSLVCPSNVATRIFGVPILGERLEVKPPEDAIPAEEAARIILDGVARREGIIVFPESEREVWRSYWRDPEAAEKPLREMARRRRDQFEKTGSYY